MTGNLQGSNITEVRLDTEGNNLIDLKRVEIIIGTVLLFYGKPKYGRRCNETA